jgi:hypothetical protein
VQKRDSQKPATVDPVVYIETSGTPWDNDIRGRSRRSRR